MKSIEGAVEIPADAQEVQVWFKGWAYGNSVWDSAYGENYRFAITR